MPHPPAAPLPARPKVITFDTYGTLIDWDGALKAYLVMLFGPGFDVESFYARWYYSHALPAVTDEPFKIYRELLADTMLAACAAEGVEITEEQAARLGDVMADAPPFPDTIPVLDVLRRAFPLGTISNSQKDILDSSARRMNDPFTHAITAEVVGAYKPAAELFELILDRAGAEPHEAVHVAQSQYVDLPRSVPMGIPTIWINRNSQALHPDHPAPTLVLPNLLGVPDALGLPRG
ncbi:HAD-IA family hydrolase [Microbacterium sp. RD1]|uniref:HAD-IA family hydrolase n=1 Tax=Microbacterium sp. RD1 TaxID=3457313 RepID=UPI003FA53CE0